MKSHLGLLALISAILLLQTACSSDNFVPGHTEGLPLLVTSQASQTLASFEMSSSGKLSANGNAISTGASSVPNATIIVGSAAFVANGGTNDIARFTINGDGSLSAISGNQGTGLDPAALALTHDGNHLLVANYGDQTVSVFRISGTTLTPSGTVTSGAGPMAFGVSPTGKYVYVANSLDGTISGYTFSDSSGTLTAMTLSPFSSLGSTPDALSITPDGNFLYAANFGSNTIAAFSICTSKSVICPAADGRLVPFLSPTVLAGIGPRAMAINPAGNSLFVANQFSNQVAMYNIVPTFDILTGLTFSLVKPNNPAFISSGEGPVSIAIPTGGAFLYTANNGSSSISSFSIDPAGLLLPDGETTTGGQPSSLGPK